MRPRVLSMLVLALAGLAGPIGCGEPDGPVVVAYVSADRAVALPVLEAFTERTGIEVLPLFDSEATKTTGLANRIRRERDRVRADVFWSSEPIAVEQLAAEGLLMSAGHPSLVDHPEQWRRSDDRWFAFAGRARVLVVDPARLPVDERPTTWLDLANPRWRDGIAMADPRFGTTRGHVGALAIADGIDFDDWSEALARNRVRLLTGGNAATVDAVARGEVLLGLTDSDDVIAARRRGVPVEAIVPRHLPDGVPGGGTMLVPNAAGVVTGAANLEAANELVAFLASAEVERILLATPSGNIPIAHPLEAGERETVPADVIMTPDPWSYSVTEVAGAVDGAVDRFMAIVSEGAVR